LASALFSKEPFISKSLFFQWLSHPSFTQLMLHPVTAKISSDYYTKVHNGYIEVHNKNGLGDAFSSTNACVLDDHVDPNEWVMPPKLEVSQELNYTIAKSKELLNSND
jgi:hypothetical protein